jgi:hypothetical protein
VAEAVTSASEAGPAPDASSPPARRRRRPRFLLAYALLAAIVGTTAVVLAVLLTRADENESRGATRQWSQWRPTAGGVEGAQQIANFVSERYRLPDGRQLAAVRAGPPTLENVEISAIAVRTSQATDGEDNFSVTRVEDGVVYAMCGLARRCSLPGEPTEQRGRLVRREALELALYTFTYLDVDTVVTFLPPQRSTTTIFVLYFRRSDLEEQLAQPLGMTLPEESAPLAAEIDPAAAQLIDGLTVPHLFQFGFQQLQDGTLMLVLRPPEPE